MDANDSVVEAIAIRGGDVYQTGSNGTITRLARPEHEADRPQRQARAPGPDRRPHPRDARGLPLLGPGRAIRPPDLARRRAQQYRDKVAELEDGRWIWTNAGGWNINQFDDPRPFTFEELTAIAPKNPMWVAGSGFTGPRVNQAAFDLLGLTASSPGVEVVDGQVTGRLTGDASAASNDAIRAQLTRSGSTARPSAWRRSSARPTAAA